MNEEYPPPILNIVDSISSSSPNFQSILDTELGIRIIMENIENTPTLDFLHKLVKEYIEVNKNKGNLNRKLRYVIYARKSSEDEEHQIKSIPEQVDACLKFVEAKELDIVGTPIIEKKSAKESGKRKQFDQMLKDLEAEKYDGIVCWHPDRLSRNMKEAGVIVDMLDKGVIRDLKFCDFSFENNSSGKMLLGITFVLSKQYSDHLSDSVSRGNKFHVEDGESIGRDKHGYFRDENNYYRADDRNFDLICEAWKMRVNGKNLTEIADYLNDKKYNKAYGIEGKVHKLYRMSDKVLSVLFKDTFYAGILKIGNNTSNLTEKYHFTPTVSPADFLLLNKRDNIMKSFVVKKGLRRGAVKGSFLRRTVICESCGEFMTTAVTTKYGKDHKLKQRIYYFRCKTHGCKRIKKNVRGVVVLNQLMDFIKNNLIASKQYYDSYVTEMERLRVEKRKELNNEKMSLFQFIKNEEVGIEKLKTVMSNLEDKDSINEFSKSLKVRLKSVEDKKKRTEEIKKLLENADKAIIPYEEFVELFKKLPKELEKVKSLSRKSEYLQKILANCILKEEKVVSLHLNPPFDRLVPSENLVVSGE